MSSDSTDPDRSALAGFTFVLLGFGLWALARPYGGLVHDSRLYALQALGRLSPDSLGQDVFLRFGSQDAFTIFSPAYGAAIAVFGLDDAALLLSLAGHLWWFGALAAVATRMLGPARGLAAVALVAGLPGFYSAWDVFRYAEPFLTPRLFGEAAVLTGVALLIRQHRAMAAGFMLLGMAIHPLMSFPGLLLWAGAVLPARLAWALPSAVISGTVLALAIALVIPAYPLIQFEAEWLELVRLRSPFLSMADWNADSWKTAAFPLVALWMFRDAWTDQPSRRVLGVTLVIGVLGLAVTLLGATLTNVVLITQGQAWRWTWIASVLVVIAGVRAVPVLARQGPGHASALMLLAISWLLAGWPALGFACLAALTLRLGSRLRERSRRHLQLVVTAVLCATILQWLMTRGWPGADASQQGALTGLTEALKAFSSGGVSTILIVSACFWAIGRPSSRRLATILVATFALAAGSYSFAGWSSQGYLASDDRVLSEWQMVIPATAEVFWPDDPGASWFLLARRAYVSAEQTAGILFSERAADEIRRRVEEVSLILPPAFAFRASAQGLIWTVTETSLAATCRRAAIDFIVSRESLSLPQAASPMSYFNPINQDRDEVYLYRCSDAVHDEVIRSRLPDTRM